MHLIRRKCITTKVQRLLSYDGNILNIRIVGLEMWLNWRYRRCVCGQRTRHVVVVQARGVRISKFWVRAHKFSSTKDPLTISPRVHKNSADLRPQTDGSADRTSLVQTERPEPCDVITQAGWVGRVATSALLLLDKRQVKHTYLKWYTPPHLQTHWHGVLQGPHLTTTTILP